MESIPIVFKNEKIVIFKCEDLFYPNYAGRYFVLEKSYLYGYFYQMIYHSTFGGYNILHYTCIMISIHQLPLQRLPKSFGGDCIV